MRAFKKKKRSVQPQYNLLLHCLFYLKVIFTHFLVFLGLPVPLIVSRVQGSLQSGSGSTPGQRIERGHIAAKCLHAASFPHFNWAI